MLCNSISCVFYIFLYVALQSKKERAKSEKKKEQKSYRAYRITIFSQMQDLKLQLLNLSALISSSIFSVVNLLVVIYSCSTF